MDEKHVVAYSQCRSSRYMWSVRDLNLESMTSFSTRVTRFDQTQYKYKQYMQKVSLVYHIMFGSGGTFLYHKGEVQLFILLFEIKFSNNKTSRIKFSLFYYISFHNNLSDMGSLIISSQQQHDFQEKYYVSLSFSHNLSLGFKVVLSKDFQFNLKRKA